MNALHKAEALIEALDYFRAFRKKIIVVKLGGSIMDDSDCLNSTLAALGKYMCHCPSHTNALQSWGRGKAGLGPRS